MADFSIVFSILLFCGIDACFGLQTPKLHVPNVIKVCPLPLPWAVMSLCLRTGNFSFMLVKLPLSARDPVYSGPLCVLPTGGHLSGGWEHVHLDLWLCAFRVEKVLEPSI